MNLKLKIETDLGCEERRDMGCSISRHNPEREPIMNVA